MAALHAVWCAAAAFLLALASVTGCTATEDQTRPRATHAAPTASDTAQHDTPNPRGTREPRRRGSHTPGPRRTVAPSSPPTIEATRTNPFAGLDSTLSGTIDGGAGSDPRQWRIPADGTTVWGDDGCVWQVVQGYWIQSARCRVPASDNPYVYFYYTRGTDPGTAWYEKSDTTPSITANGQYYVYRQPRVGYWQRCSADCADPDAVEVYFQYSWYTADQWSQIAHIDQQVRAARQARQAVDQQQYTLMVGGQNRLVLRRQGAPADLLTSINPAQQIIDDLDQHMVDIALAAKCDSPHNGCS